MLSTAAGWMSTATWSAPTSSPRPGRRHRPVGRHVPAPRRPRRALPGGLRHRPRLRSRHSHGRRRRPRVRRRPPYDAARLWDLSVFATGATPFTATPGQPARRSAASGGRGRTPCEGPARGTPNQGLPRALPAREDGHRTVAARAALRPVPRAPTVPARDHPLDHLPPGQTPPLYHRAPGPTPRPLPGTSAHLRPGPPVRRHARQPGRNTPAGLARRSLPQRPGTALPVLPELCTKTSMPSPRGLPPPLQLRQQRGSNHRPETPETDHGGTRERPPPPPPRRPHRPPPPFRGSVDHGISEWAVRGCLSDSVIT